MVELSTEHERDDVLPIYRRCHREKQRAIQHLVETLYILTPDKNGKNEDTCTRSTGLRGSHNVKGQWNYMPYDRNSCQVWDTNAMGLFVTLYYLHPNLDLTSKQVE